ncbi:hypothetical protein HDU82_008969 [Entophlyctis luteolus]|nr:hypothetical protein HDU82_008969 [Entophlyctis luteolus]
MAIANRIQSLTRDDLVEISREAGLSLDAIVELLPRPESFATLKIIQIRHIVAWARMAMQSPRFANRTVSVPSPKSSKKHWVLALQAVFYDGLYRYPQGRDTAISDSAAAPILETCAAHVERVSRAESTPDARPNQPILTGASRAVASRRPVSPQHTPAPAALIPHVAVASAARPAAVPSRRSAQPSMFILADRTSAPDIAAKIESSLRQTHRLVRVWTTVSFAVPDSNRHILPPPVKFALELNESHLSEVVETNYAGSSSNLRDGISIIWDFSGTGGIPMNGSLLVEVCGAATSAGYVSQNQTRIDITQAICSNIARLTRMHSPSLDFNISFFSSNQKRHQPSTITTVVYVLKKFSPREFLTQMYRTELLRSSNTELRANASLEELHQNLVDKSLTRQISIMMGADNTDEEIFAGDVTISFLCPLTLLRIVYPVKGAKCDHFQPFDGESFLQLYAKTEKLWSCVVCGKAIDTPDLKIDLQMLRLLAKYPSQDKCVVKPDGTDAEAVSTDNLQPGKHRPNGAGALVILDDDAAAAVVPGKKRELTETDGVINIDDDDDDDDHGGEDAKDSVRDDGIGRSVQTTAARSQRGASGDVDDDVPLMVASRKRRRSQSDAVGYTIVERIGQGGTVVETIVID